MFKEASLFNNGDQLGVSTKPLLWTVSNVLLMTGMFMGASNFNQDIGSWNVSNVWDMSGMFMDASSFNADLSEWRVSSKTDLSRMFEKSGVEAAKNLPTWYK